VNPDSLIATLMMTLGYMLMVYPRAGMKLALTAAIVGFVLREAYLATYEQDDVLDAAIAQLDKIN